jgi:hypothetical protein
VQVHHGNAHLASPMQAFSKQALPGVHRVLSCASGAPGELLQATPFPFDAVLVAPALPPSLAAL